MSPAPSDVIRELRLGAEATQFLEEIDPPEAGSGDRADPLVSGADRYRLFFRTIVEETMSPESPPGDAWLRTSRRRWTSFPARAKWSGIATT